jgi:integrase
MIDVYVRHTAACPKRDEGKAYKRCRCPKWFYGDIPGQGPRSRVSAKSRSWEKAEQEARRLEGGDPLSAVRNEDTRVTIATAVTEYLQASADQGIASDTKLKKTRTFQATDQEKAPEKKPTKRKVSPSLLGWCKDRGFTYLEELGTREMTQWRSTWEMKPLARSKRQGMVCGFFYFCKRQGWIKKNPMLDIGAIKVTDKPTDYFPQSEFDAIVDATYIYRGSRWGENDTRFGERLRILTLLMRWSGLAIRDAVTLRRDRLGSDDSIFLYRAKTGHPVRVLLPPDVATALRNIPPGNAARPDYFLWSGVGLPKSAVADWQRSYRRLFKLAKLPIDPETRKSKRAHPHMFRDTFAIEMLLSGATLEQVQMLLGHKSIKTTEKSYAPWVKARQEMLDDTVKKAWTSQTLRLLPGGKKKKAG